MDVTNITARNLSVTAPQPARVDNDTATRVGQDTGGRTQEASRQEEIRRSQIEQNQEARDTREARREAEERRLEAIARREEELENVVAVSEDGDTLQVEGENADIRNEDIGGVTVLSSAQTQMIPPGPEEIEAAEVMNTAAVTPPPEPPVVETVEVEPPEPPTEPVVAAAADNSANSANSTAEQTARENFAVSEENEETTTTTARTDNDFTGISDARLEQMYLRGEISRQDYESEIEAREEEREQQEQEQGQFSNRMGTIERVGRQAEQNGAAIREAVSDEANDTLTAEQRLDIIEDLQQDNTQEANREEESRNVWQSQFLA